MTPNRTLTLLLAAISCALVLLTACGGGSDPTPSPTVRVTADPNATLTARPTRTSAGSSGTDACSLISPASIVTLIGALSNTEPASGQCTYTGTDGQLTVQLELETSLGTAVFKVGATPSGAEDVDVGDAAYFDGSKVVGRMGMYFFTISTTVQKDNLKDALVALAQSAVASLPAS